MVVASSDITVRRLICSSLIRDRRFEVMAQATDGDSAVTCPFGFDAAIVDVSIPGLGILGVLSGLHDPPADRVVVVVSRSNAVYLRHACLAEGADDYLVWPDELNELPDRVVEAVHASQNAPDPRPILA